MSFLDNFKKAAQNIPDARGVLNAVDQVAAVAMPVELQNLQTTKDTIAQKLSSFGQSGENADSVIHLRTYLMSFYGNLQDGGEPVPNALTAARVKAMPQYQRLVKEYPQLAQQVSALEKQYLQCAFGYKMADGSILEPDITWTREQWEQTKAQAVQPTARCWSGVNGSNRSDF